MSSFRLFAAAVCLIVCCLSAAPAFARPCRGDSCGTADFAAADDRANDDDRPVVGGDGPVRRAGRFSLRAGRKVACGGAKVARFLLGR